MADEKSSCSARSVQRAIFLDRDGTIIEDVGALGNPRQIELYPETIPALLKLQDHFLLFIITNQSGVAQGKLSMDQVHTVNQTLNEMLLQKGIKIQEWYVCPHRREDHCDCIKPKPEFVLRAQRDYAVDPAQSFVIGDHPHDAYTANELGVLGIYLLSGHGKKHRTELKKDTLVLNGISDAADWVLAHTDRRAAEQSRSTITSGASADV